jgi:hypothetical protein
MKSRTTLAVLIVLTSSVLTLLSSAGSSAAGPIADAFGPGVFGLEWGADRAKVSQVFPGGKSGRIPIDYYAAWDSRTIFGIERNNQRITFSFAGDGRLSCVRISFGASPMKYAKLLNALRDQFGPPLEDNSGRINPNGYHWPSDGRIHLELVQADDILPNTQINVCATAEVAKDRASLGLE